MIEHANFKKRIGLQGQIKSPVLANREPQVVRQGLNFRKVSNLLMVHCQLGKQDLHHDRQLVSRKAQLIQLLQDPHVL